MEISLAVQMQGFILATVAGFALAILYDALKMVRTMIRSTPSHVFWMDLAFMAVAGIVTFLLALAASYGEVRFYLLAGEGIGFTEAPRGALCHYMRVKNGVIDDYAVVAASMWNCSPRDDAGKRGAVEEALIGVPVPEVDSPVNVGRVIRAYDP